MSSLGYKNSPFVYQNMKSIPGTITDIELIKRLREPDQDHLALQYLYRHYYGPCGHYITANSGSQDDAQDIFQEVVVAFVYLVRENKFRGDSSIKTFLYALNRNLWLNELKRRGRAHKREEKYGMLGNRNLEKADVLIEQREAHQILVEVMETLGDKCRQILLLFYYENHSMKEIAQRTDYENEQVVRNKKYKCLKKLEEKITASPSLFAQMKNLLHV